MDAGKKHQEFVQVDMESGWEQPAGYKAGFWQKVLSSKSYEWAADSVFDNPLSSRFDENDAVLISTR